MIGPRDRKVNMPVCSPISTREIPTVKRGAEDLTVSVKDTATYLRATRPRTTVENLKGNKSIMVSYNIVVMMILKKHF